MRWAALPLSLALSALLLVLGGAGTASAHAVLRASDPQDGSVLAVAPRFVTLTFTESVGLLDDFLRMFGPDGHRVRTGTPRHAAGRPDTVRVALPARPGGSSGGGRGTFTVAWRAVSADSHPVSGAFTFSVGRPSATAATVRPGPVEDPLTGALYDLARYVAYVAVALLVGTAAFVMLCRPPEPAALRTPFAAGAWTLLASTLVLLVLRAPYETGQGPAAAFSGSAATRTLTGRPGQALLARLVLLAAAAVLARRSVRTARPAPGRMPPGVAAAGGALAVALALTWAAADHASAGVQVPLAVASAVLHLLAMAVWMGGLVALLTMLNRGAGGGGRDVEAAAETVARFSRAAFAAVTVLVVTGVYQSWRGLGSWQALTGTAYGRILLAKTITVVLLLAAAAYSRRWTSRRTTTDRRRTARGIAMPEIPVPERARAARVLSLAPGVAETAGAHADRGRPARGVGVLGASASEPACGGEQLAPIAEVEGTAGAGSGRGVAVPGASVSEPAGAARVLSPAAELEGTAGARRDRGVAMPEAAVREPAGAAGMSTPAAEVAGTTGARAVPRPVATATSSSRRWMSRWIGADRRRTTRDDEVSGDSGPEPVCGTRALGAAAENVRANRARSARGDAAEASVPDSVDSAGVLSPVAEVEGSAGAHSDRRQSARSDAVPETSVSESVGVEGAWAPVAEVEEVAGAGSDRLRPARGEAPGVSVPEPVRSAGVLTPATEVEEATRACSDRERSSRGDASPDPSVPEPVRAPRGDAGPRPAEPGLPAPGRVRPDVRILRRSVLAEVALGVLVLVLTTVLTGAEPGRARAEAARAASAAPAAGPGALVTSVPFDVGTPNGHGSVQVTLEPGRVGVNTVQAVVFGPDGGLATVPELRVTFTHPGRDLGPFDAGLTDEGGYWGTADLNLPLPGTWLMRTTVRVSELDEVTVTRRVTIVD
ncbi:copper resistance protein CopC [Streptomyces sp. NPDC090306]|uniref:copper resistance protein CopC n=1 Tax=Streptomyces sp. NPDC090306 TaxID=3365961 RepID=UPI0038151403